MLRVVVQSTGDGSVYTTSVRNLRGCCVCCLCDDVSLSVQLKTYSTSFVIAS